MKQIWYKISSGANAAPRYTPAIHTQGSLRGGVPLLNEGSGGRYPQILVLPTLKKLASHKFYSFADWLDPSS